MVSENKQNIRYKQINFIGFQSNRHPSQHIVGNVHKASENCKQRAFFRNARQQCCQLTGLLGLEPVLSHLKF
jgi:hypothetical protein